jgi:RNA polymerase sigma factor (sigma-70 family)
MKKDCQAEDPSSASNLEAVRNAAATDGLGKFRPETLVATVQRLGPMGEPDLLQKLVLFLSELILRLLRKRIRPHHPNEGKDMIDAAHEKLLTALLVPGTKDGAGLSSKFVLYVNYRADDEIAAEQKRRRRFKSLPLDQDDQYIYPADNRTPDDQAEQLAHVEQALSKVPDERKRKAFRLHMEGVPAARGKGATSISEQLGVSAKTAGEWIEEVRQLLIDAGVEK